MKFLRKSNVSGTIQSLTLYIVIFLSVVCTVSIVSIKVMMPEPNAGKAILWVVISLALLYIAEEIFFAKYKRIARNYEEAMLRKKTQEELYRKSIAEVDRIPDGFYGDLLMKKIKEMKEKESHMDFGQVYVSSEIIVDSVLVQEMKELVARRKRDIGNFPEVLEIQKPLVKPKSYAFFEKMFPPEKERKQSVNC